LLLQNLLKVFNGYWRMEFPDWGVDTCWGLIIKTYNSAIKLSSVNFISLFSAGFFQTKLASQHDGGDILAFSRRRHFL